MSVTHIFDIFSAIFDVYNVESKISGTIPYELICFIHATRKLEQDKWMDYVIVQVNIYPHENSITFSVSFRLLKGIASSIFFVRNFSALLISRNIYIRIKTINNKNNLNMKLDSSCNMGWYKCHEAIYYYFLTESFFVLSSLLDFLFID